ncbi:MAG: sigma-54-dependent Fis family transcriptional regulator [Tissierellia bacterium]|nr:sigma-54-dependent Fis family transcriptional regulator [Tissierellia bacterium]
MNKVLIIDDERSICDSLSFALEDDFQVLSTQNPQEGIEIVKNEDIDIVLLDLKIGNVNGIDVLRKIKHINEDTQVIVMTAYGSIESTVEAMKVGAIHYLLKPINIDELKVFMNKALDFRMLNSSLKNLRNIVVEDYSINGIIGRSKAFTNVLGKVEKVKDIDTTVLINGESGTGKDIIAKAIHFQGARKDERIEIVNCAAIPGNLLESELFGYEKGAFTGAVKKKLGKIELANNGTLFLDEIGEMDLGLQAKILRVVEDMTITPLGAEIPKKVDVRIIAATNKNLLEEVKNGRFREDLYYRLNVITIDLPNLTERREDIIPLSKFFLDKYNKKLNKNIAGFSVEAIRVLEKYDYPGNIRELENIIERAVALTDNPVIELEDLPENVLKFQNKPILSNNQYPISIGMSLKEIEKEAILRTLKHYDGNRTLAAECLGISIRNLQYKLKAYNYED